MKSIVTAAFIAIACSPVLASEPTTPPSAMPVEAPTTAIEANTATTANPATTATPSAPVKVTPTVFTETLPIQSTNPNPSFCRQDTVLRLLEKTELGQQLQLRQQEALRASIAQAEAERRIPVTQPAEPVATTPQPAQPAPGATTESTTPNPAKPQE